MNRKSSDPKRDIHSRIESLSSDKRALFELRMKKKEAASVGIGGLSIPQRVNLSSIPLSFAQQRLWFIEQFEPGSAAYNVSTALRLVGVLDIEVLQKVLNEIVRRHESLRTTFKVRDGVPVQHIEPHGEIPLALLDVKCPHPAEQKAKVLQLLKQEASRSFDLEQGPLLRSVLIQEGNQEHILLLSIHHIVCDAWSRSILLSEFSGLYKKFRKGDLTPRAELIVQYGDFSEWQCEWLQGDVFDKQLAYWKKQLESPPVLDLPIDRPRPLAQSFCGAKLPFIIPEEITRGIKSLSRTEDATLFMTLLTAFNVLLFRYSAQEDLAIGTPIANRSRTELEDLIGFFANTIVLRTDLSGNPTFKKLLLRVRDVALAAYANQDLPFEKLVEELVAERDLSRTPLFQVMFVLQNAPAQKMELDDVTISQLSLDTDIAKFDLTVELLEGDGVINGCFEYNTDLFNPETVERMAEHFQNILKGIAADPSLRLSDIPVLADVERHQLLFEWSGEKKECFTDQPIHHFFEQWVQKAPEATAVVMENHHLTYLELNSRANKLSRHLTDLGVGCEGRVAIFLERSIDVIICMLATLKAGGTYVPLDPDYPEERTGYMLKDASVQIVITHKYLVSLLPETSLPLVLLDKDWPDIAQKSDANPSKDVSPEHLAYILYTSRSTGRPKGVMISHRNVVGFLLSYQQVTLDKQRIGTSVAPFNFDVSVDEIYSALCFGGTLHVMRPIHFTDAAYFARYLADHKITTSYILPDFLSDIAEQLESVKDRMELRCLITGLAPKKQSVLQKFRYLDNELRILNAYGPTEVTYGATAFVFQQAFAPDQDVPIGKPFPNYEVYIVDKNLQLVPIGVKGELLIGGVGLGKGYLNRDDLTAEKFIPHLFSDEPNAKLYRTGDLVCYQQDGNIRFFGRLDDQVKIRGFRVEPGDIQKNLMLHACVQDAVVIAKSGKVRDLRLIAYVVARKSKIISVRQLRDFLKTKLPDYMVPSAYVILEALPLMANGKIDRSALPEPEQVRFEQGYDYIAPRTATEVSISEIWCKILGLHQVGIHDNFFESGGHSLLTFQLLARLREKYHVEIPLKSFFDKPTVAWLSGCINEAQKGKQQFVDTPMITGSRKGHAPLSFSQQRLWFLNQFAPESSAYNVFLSVQLHGQLSIETLEKSFKEIIRRHEVLRTSFITEGDDPIQKVNRNAGFTIQKTDFSKISSSQKDAELIKLAEKESAYHFDLSSELLLRVNVVKLEPEKHVLLLTIHHIVCDAWSLNILYREISLLYASFLQGAPSPLVELPLQYAEFAQLQRKWLSRERVKEQVVFWKDNLEGIKALELPTDRRRPAAQTFRSSKHVFQLPKSFSKALQKLSRTEHVTLFMTVLAVFKSMLHRYTGQNDISVGIPIANRNISGSESAIGFFLNTLVIRSDTSGDPSFRELLQLVRSNLLNAYDHQDLPFEQLVEELQPKRHLDRNPLFQVLFTLRSPFFSNLELPGLAVSPIEFEHGNTRFDLEMHFVEEPESLRGAFIYNTDLFDDATVERMVSQYVRIVKGIVSNPDLKLSELPLLTGVERHQILKEWNKTAADYPRDKCIHELFQEQVKKYPDAASISFGNETLTYVELNNKANQLAHFLRKAGVAPDVLVAICLERSLAMVICVLGILKAGGAYVPLDPGYPERRLKFMLNDSGSPLLLTDKKLLEEVLPENKTRRICLDDTWKEIEKESVQNLTETTSPNNLAYVLYTSGSTGKPKGVAMPHGSLCNLISWQTNNSTLPLGGKTLQFASLSFDVSFQEIFSTLCCGGHLVVLPEELHRDPAALLQHLEEESIARLFLPFVALQQLAEVAAEYDGLSLSLQEVITAGEQLQVTSSIVRMFEKLHNCRLFNQYGPTESHVVTALQLTGLAGEWPSLPAIGRPIANTEIYILDSHYQPVPVGVAGELYVGGNCLAREYLNHPELTKEKFIPNPFSQQQDSRLYRTGDLVKYLPDGNVEYLGRLDHQLKIRGFRIEPGEIEVALVNHSIVNEAIATVRLDETGNSSLIAFVVLNQKPQSVIKQLRSYLKNMLPDYMIPSTFVVLASLPLTPSGKVDRMALPVPEVDRSELDTDFVGPRTQVEKGLTSIWSEVLGHRQVGVDDDFFELGGHSLLATRLVSRIHEKFNLAPPLRVIFENPSIAGQAEYIEDRLKAQKMIEPTVPSSSSNRDEFIF